MLPSTVVVSQIPIEKLHDPNLISFDSVCQRAIAKWRSFGGSSSRANRLKIRSAITRGVEFEDTELVHGSFPKEWASRFDSFDQSVKAVQVLAASLSNNPLKTPPTGNTGKTPATDKNRECHNV